MGGIRIRIKTGTAVSFGLLLVSIASGQPASPPVRADVTTTLLGHRDLWPAEGFRRWQLETLETWLAEARFEKVLEEAASLRTGLLSPPGSDAAVPVARLETLAATAYIALGSPEKANACFRRALRAVPTLELDAVRTAPKVLEVFAQARAEMDLVRARIVAGERATRDVEGLQERPTPVDGVPEVAQLDGPTDAPPELLEGARPRLADLGPNPALPLRPTITCRILIDESGRVVRARVYRSRAALQRFEAAALEAVRAYRFEPARRSGRRTSVWVNWPVQFR